MQKTTKALLFVLLAAAPLVALAATGTISSTNKYAWGNTAGYINFAPSQSTVTVSDTGLTGYAWSQNNGWINLAASQGGVTNTTSGTLGGFAWDSSAGWVSFTGVTIDTSGRFHGTATGANGYTINFDCTYCNVTTTWRPGGSASTGGGGGGIISGPGSVGYPGSQPTTPPPSNPSQPTNPPPTTGTGATGGTPSGTGTSGSTGTTGTSGTVGTPSNPSNPSSPTNTGSQIDSNQFPTTQTGQPTNTGPVTGASQGGTNIATTTSDAAPSIFMTFLRSVAVPLGVAVVVLIGAGIYFFWWYRRPSY